MTWVRTFKLALASFVCLVSAFIPSAQASLTSADIKALVKSERYVSAPFDQRLGLLNAYYERLASDADDHVWAELTYHKINTLARVGDFELATDFLEEVHGRFIRVAKDAPFYVDALYPAVFIYIYAGDVEKALINLELMKDAPGYDNNINYQQYADTALSAIYSNTGNSILAAELLIEAYESGRSEAYKPLDQLKLLSNIGYSLVISDEFNRAEEYITIAQGKLAQSDFKDTLTSIELSQIIWHLHSNLASIYIFTDRTDELTDVYNEMKIQAERLGSPLIDTRTEYVLAACMYGSGYKKKALALLDDILVRAQKLVSTDILMDINEFRARILRDLGRYEEALQAHIAKQEIFESLSNEKVHAKSKFLEARLNLQRKNIEIEKLAAQNMTAMQLRRRDQQFLWVTVGALISTIFFCATLILSRRRLARYANALRRSERKAQEAAKAKAAFLANMSHEIRTPLNGLMGMAQLLASKEMLPEQREYIDIITDSGQTLLTVVNDVLDYSKIEAGKMELDCVPTNITRHMDQIVRLWRPAAAEKGLTLNVSIEKSVPEALDIDPVRTRQCLSNLISNAIKFTDSGRIDVCLAYEACSNSAGVLQMSVRDTGVGISKEAVGRLFSAFEQADSSTTREYGGTGLGLTITSDLAQLMGGNVSVESKIGEGSVFTLRINAARSKDASSSLSQPNEAVEAQKKTPLNSTDPIRVLLVDDNVVNRMIARAFLEEWSVDVVEAEHGKEALDRLQEGAGFDLMLLDIQMPVMDGPSVIKVVRASEEAWRDIPIIALTAHAMAGDRDEYIAMGANGYVPKPIVKGGLIKEISRVLNGGALKDRAA